MLVVLMAVARLVAPLIDPYSIGEVNCSKQEPREHLKDKYKPILCRKTVQKGKITLKPIQLCLDSK